MEPTEICKFPCIYLGGLAYLRTTLDLNNPDDLKVYQEIHDVVKEHCKNRKKPCSRCCPPLKEFTKLKSLLGLNIGTLQYFTNRVTRRVDRSLPNSWDAVIEKYPLKKRIIKENIPSSIINNPDGSREGTSDSNIEEPKAESSGRKIGHIKIEPGLEDQPSNIDGPSE